MWLHTHPQSSELRGVAAEGLAKLMLCGRVLSARLLSRLVLLWYNPITEDDNRLRHCLGAFFPIFAFAGQYVTSLKYRFYAKFIHGYCITYNTDVHYNFKKSNCSGNDTLKTT